jgi:hypothetical protein
VGETRFEAFHVAADLRPDISIDHGSGEPLEFPVFPQDLVGQRDIGVRHRLPDHRTSDPLVIGIGVSVQKTDGDRLDALLFKHFAGVGDAALVERGFDFAAGQEALDHFQC